jgi:nitrogen-specific signal transduction histidine kinase
LELLRTTGAFPKQLRREVRQFIVKPTAPKIVRNLLVFAGSRHLARRSVSLNAVLQKVLALRAAGHRAADIEVVRHYDKLRAREGDPLLLHQVFLNMVINADMRSNRQVTAGASRSMRRWRVPAIGSWRPCGTPGSGFQDTLSRIFSRSIRPKK